MGMALDFDEDDGVVLMQGSLGGGQGDRDVLLQLREQHAEQAQAAFTLQTTKSWNEVMYWMVRSSLHRVARPTREGESGLLCSTMNSTLLNDIIARRGQQNVAQ
jgi:hypothetical protein